MEKIEIEKYLGMSIHLMYYYFDDLNGSKNRYRDLNSDIKKRLRHYFNDFKIHLEYGIANFEEVYPKLEHLNINKYPKSDVELFFTLFYKKLLEIEKEA